MNTLHNRPAGRPRKDGRIKVGTIYLTPGNWRALQQIKEAMLGAQQEASDSVAINAVIWALRTALVQRPALERLASLPPEPKAFGGN